MSVKSRAFPQLADIDLKLLRIFYAIVKNDGFSAAQYELNMSLPAISSAMTQLEQRLGFKLCERGRGGFELTEGGGLVFRELRRLFESIDQFQDAVHQYVGDLHGQIAIAVDDAIVTNYRCPLHLIIRQFVQSAPKLHVNLTIMAPPKMEQAMLEKQLTIAVGPFRETSDALKKTQLYNETQLLCCGRGHPAFGISDRRQADAAISKSDYAARNYKDESFNLDNAQFSKSFSVSNMEALLALILTGKYIGYLPRHFCEDWVEKGEVWTILPEFYSYKTPISALHRKNHNDPRVSLFLAAIEAHR